MEQRAIEKFCVDLGETPIVMKRDESNREKSEYICLDCWYTRDINGFRSCVGFGGRCCKKWETIISLNCIYFIF